jgi:hypothetical protein
MVFALIPAMARAQPKGVAVLSGIVTDGATHLPLQGAQVGVGAANARTDSEGAYALEVRPGRIRPWAARGGYMTLVPGPEIDITEAAGLKQDFVLYPAPHISGTVIDAETGEPLKGCVVFAMRRIMAMGQAWYTSAGIPTGDARNGTFETVGLDPGEYVLEINGCAWSYYPDVSRIEMATPLTVTQVGVRGLSIKIRRRGLRVSGVADHGAVDVRLVRHIDDVAQTLAQVRADASGHFEFQNVPEGEFHLVTSAGGHRVITVTDHDLTGIELHGEPFVMPDISVRTDDGSDIATSDVRPELAPVFDGEPSPHWPRLNRLPTGFVVASVDTSGPRITFHITAKTGRLTGKSESKNAAAIAIREPYAPYLDQSELPRTRTGADGVYSFDKLAPGKYKVVVLTGNEELLERNEAFLRKKADFAPSVEVTAPQ